MKQPITKIYLLQLSLADATEITRRRITLQKMSPSPKTFQES